MYQLEHRPLQQQEQKQNKPSDPTYCKACKKKFSNEPTFQNHLKSAKHIANEKKFGKTDKTSTQRVPINPQVQGKK